MQYMYICAEVRMRSGDVKPECMVFLSALGHYQGAMVYTRALARVWEERERRGRTKDVPLIFIRCECSGK